MTCQCLQCRHYHNPAILQQERQAQDREFQKPRFLKPMSANLAYQYAD